MGGTEHCFFDSVSLFNCCCAKSRPLKSVYWITAANTLDKTNIDSDMKQNLEFINARFLNISPYIQISHLRTLTELLVSLF